MFFSSLRHRNFRIFYIGTTISGIGTWTHRIAQDWLVLELTNSAQALGVVVGAQFLPGFFFSLFGGSLADRVDHRRALMVCNASGALIALLLGILVLTHHSNIWNITLSAFLLGTTTALDGPIRQSYYIILVDEKDLPNALSLNSANINIARLIGPVLSGVLIEAYGSGPLFIINSVTYLVVFLTIVQIRPSEYMSKTIAGSIESKTKIRDGFTYVMRKPELFMSIFAVSFLAMWGQDMQITSAMMAKDTFAQGAASFGALGSIFALGAVIGALSFSRRKSMPTIKTIGFRGVIMSSAWFLAGISPTYSTFAAALLICGWCSMGVNISGNASIRTYTDTHFYGRSWGVYIFTYLSLSAVGAPILGWINQNFSPRIAVIYGAVMALMMSLYVLIRFRPGRP